MSLLDSLTKSLVEVYASSLNEQEQKELIEALEVLASDEKYNMFKNTFPDEGPYRRELYKKHLEFFAAGAKYRERAVISSNRSGKTIAAIYEVVCHATGLYPEWWVGRKFSYPVRLLMSGDTAQTCRDILQQKLLGNPGDFGSGMLPKDCLIDTKSKRNIPDAVESIRVKHVTGGVSTISFKSYDQGREIFQGNEYDGIFFDEEAPLDVYSEALIRTMTTGGFTVLTFTPLSGLTDLVVNFLENSQETDTKYPKHVTNITWWDVPHLSAEDIEQMLAATPPQLRDARSKGEPTVGSGRIYPISSEHYIVDDFQVPKYWRKAYGFDIGWNNTAAVFGAWDETNDIIYIYSEYKQGESQPVVHASAIKARGEWLKGVIDPAARGRSQIDGTTIFSLYKQEGLKLYLANNAVEAGIYEVWDRLNTGRLKIFKSCTAIQKEFNLYIRDEKGKIVKKNDHCLVGDTLILTPNGSVPIKDLDENGFIFNRDGDVTEYKRARLIASDTKVVKIKSDKFIIEATPEHCFLGANSLWYPALMLENKSLVNLEETCKKKLSNLQRNNKVFWERPTGNVEITSNGMGNDCIELCGNILTERYLKDLQSITEILIELIMIYQISNYYTPLNTVLYTLNTTLPQELLGPFLRMLDKGLQNGTDQKQVKYGIKNIITFLKKNYTNVWTENALFAEKFISQLKLILKQAFVPIPVNLPIDENINLILKNVVAAFVEKNLNAISILKPKLVEESVGSCLVKEVSWKSKVEDVYCMDVPYGNSFVLANGIVSHNCLDALRYLCLSDKNVWSFMPSSMTQQNKVVDMRQYMAACT